MDVEARNEDAPDGAPQSRRDRMRELVTARGQVSWTAAPDGTIRDTAAWQGYTGQSDEAVAGNGWLAAIHPDDRIETTRLWLESVAAGAAYESECRIQRYD